MGNVPVCNGNFLFPKRKPDVSEIPAPARRWIKTIPERSDKGSPEVLTGTDPPYQFRAVDLASELNGT